MTSCLIATCLQYRSFGYGHSFGLLSHYYGREAGLELREDIETVLEPGMVISMEPMLTIPEGRPGAGGYREHDILIVTETGAENITGFPYGPGRTWSAEPAKRGGAGRTPPVHPPCTTRADKIAPPRRLRNCHVTATQMRETGQDGAVGTLRPRPMAVTRRSP